MKRIIQFLLLLFIFFITTHSWAQNSIWLEFENGKRMFREGEYSQALNAFRDVVSKRREIFGNALIKLDSALATRTAQSAGDSIKAIILAFFERDFISMEMNEIEKESGGSLRKKIEIILTKRIADSFRNFLDALMAVLKEVPFEKLNDSSIALRSEIIKLQSFPEAEYWIGLIFMQESEYELARLQFEKAGTMADSYVVPDERFNVLYTLSFVYKTMGNLKNYEISLLEIAEADPVFADPSRQYLRSRMMETIMATGSGSSLDKFLSLYRIKSPFALRAFDELGSFYLESNRDDKALMYLAISVDIVVTNIVETVKSRNPSYVYTNLQDLLAKSVVNQSITAYMESVNFFRLLFQLGEALERKNAVGTAKTVWSVIAAQPLAEKWKDRASIKLLK